MEDEIFILLNEYNEEIIKGTLKELRIYVKVHTNLAYGTINNHLKSTLHIKNKKCGGYKLKRIEK